MSDSPSNNPTPANGNSSLPSDAAAPVRKSTKEMTKAERRELQESQRAAKAASKPASSGGGAAAGQPKAKPSTSTSTPASAASKKDPSQSQPKQPSKPSATTPASETTTVSAASPPQRPSLAPAKRGPLDYFQHLRPPHHASPPSTAGISPSFVLLASQFQSYRIKGSNSRAIAFISALKEAIEGYQPAKGAKFTARMLLEYLDRQVDYLGKFRAAGEGMKKIVGEVKGKVAELGVDVGEEEAKKSLSYTLDEFVDTRIRKASALLADKVASKVSPEGSTIAIFGKSSAVLDGLVKAKGQGKKFDVVVVDANPLLEGRESASLLSSIGIPTTYLLLTSSTPFLKHSTHLFLGASTIASNGSVVGRCGQGFAATVAKAVGLPVTVFAESYKDGSAPRFNSLSWNELVSTTATDSPPSELITSPPSLDTTPFSKQDKSKIPTLSPLYDVIPAHLITEIVRE